MQSIHITNPHVGSVDWEVPPKVDEIIDTFPSEAQTVLRAELKTHLEAYLTVLVATLQLGDDCYEGFALLREASRVTYHTMQLFAKNQR